jgi:hypothetical protein
LNAAIGGRPSKWQRGESWYFGDFEPRSSPLPGSLVDPEHPAGWEFHLSVYNDGLFRGENRPDFRIAINVLFPRKDLKRDAERVAIWSRSNAVTP